MHGTQYRNAISLIIIFAVINITADFDRSSDIEVQESDGFAEVCVVLSGALTSPASFIVNANSSIDALCKRLPLHSNSPSPPLLSMHAHVYGCILVNTCAYMHVHVHVQLVKIMNHWIE